MPWWQCSDLTLNICIHLNMNSVHWILWRKVLTILACFENRESFPHCIHGCFLTNQPDIWTWIASWYLYNESIDLTTVDLKVGTCIKINWQLGLVQTCAKGSFSASFYMHVFWTFLGGCVTVPFKTLFKVVCHQFILDMHMSCYLLSIHKTGTQHFDWFLVHLMILPIA